MDTTYDNRLAQATSAWGAVICLSLFTFVLIASEFMPVSLLTPIADELAITEGQAGQAISISGLFAVITSLFGNTLLSRFDRRTVVFFYSGILIVSGLAVAFAPNYFIFMAGRALIGISIGGFWSLSTALLARIVLACDLPKAIAMLQGGTAFATVIAAPLGAFLGGLIGWRGAFFIVVPIGLVALIWQCLALPRMPAEEALSGRRMFGLLGNRIFTIGMVATTLAFMGQFSLSTYLRPFLENITGLDAAALAVVLLALGLAGLAGTILVSFFLRMHLRAVLIGLPMMLSILAMLLIPFGPFIVTTTALLIFWGLFTAPIPVAWNTWMTRVIPEDLEAGGGLQVALIQFAITFGAFTGGLLYDWAGWWSPFALGAVLLFGATAFAVAASNPAKMSASHNGNHLI